jgi:hypothetical protein
VSALRLIRFVIKTRLSGGALALLLFIALVMLATGLSMTFSKARSPPTPGFTELFRDYMTFMLVILMLTPLPAAAQMSVLKSDRDYLFTLPVRPRDLGLALYIAYMLLSGVYTLAFIGVYELLLGVPPLYAAINTALLIVMFTSLWHVVMDLGRRRGLLLSLALVGWSLTALVKDPVTPVSALYGYYVPGTLTLAAVSAALTYLSLSRLSRAPLLYSFPISEPLRPKGAEGSGLLSFQGVRGLRALVKLRMSLVQLGFGTRTPAATRVGVGRARLPRALVTMSAVAAALVAAGYVLHRLDVLTLEAVKGFLSSKQNSMSSFEGFMVLFLVVLFPPMYSTTFTAMALPTASVGLERPWLAFTSLEPGSYMRSSGLITSAQSLILNVPLALSYAVLGLVGVPGCLVVVPLLLIMVPSVALISHFLTAYFVLTPQIRFEGLATTRVSGKQVFLFLLLMSVMGSVFTVSLSSALSIGGPMLSLYVSIAFLAAALPLMLTRGPWRRAALNLVEGGYS